MKLKFAKGLTITAAQKARLQRFEDRLEALSKREEKVLEASDAVHEQYAILLDQIDADVQFTRVSPGSTRQHLTIVPRGEV